MSKYLGGVCKPQPAQTLSVLAGKLPPRAMGLVIDWASRHQDELMSDWELACQAAELKRIEPLE